MKLSTAIAAVAVVSLGLMGTITLPAQAASPTGTGEKLQWNHILTAIPVSGNNAQARWASIPIVCKWAYDRPHPGYSSGKRKINAHLIVKCTGTDSHKTVISLRSQMKEGGRWGIPSYRKGKKEVRVGGDLACISAPRMYQATGLVTITLPAGYKPLASQNTRYSPRLKFKRDRYGICLAVK